MYFCAEAYTLRVAKKLAKERGAFLLVFVLVALLAGWWGISSFVLRASDTLLPSPTPLADNSYRPKEPVVVRHSIVGGVHTYSGSLDIVADCDMLSTGITATGSTRAHIVVSLMVLRSGVCASQTLAPVPFSVSFAGSGDATVIFDGITVQNKKISSSVVETN